MIRLLSFSIIRNTAFLFLFVVFFTCTNYSFAQCPTWQNQPTCAGPLNAQGGTCGSSFIFCVGDSVGIISNSTGIIDSTFICWNDGTPVQSFAGNFSGCVKHYYNFRADSCVTDGQLTLFARLGVQQICSPTNGFNWVIIPIDIRFLPHAAFTLLSDTVCAYESLVMADQSCANASSFSPANVTWDFGDGTIITGTATSGISIPPHFYSIPGNYTITLTINRYFHQQL
jgi:PKD domain